MAPVLFSAQTKDRILKEMEAEVPWVAAALVAAAEIHSVQIRPTKTVRFLHLSLTEHFSVNSRNLCFRLANSEAGFAPFIIPRTGGFSGSLTG